MLLWWIDLETTGLSPTSDSILEVAVSEAALSSPFEAKPVYHAVFRATGVLLRDLPERVQVMHTANGLWTETQSDAAKRVSDVEDELLALLPPPPSVHFREDLPVLAGASVHFDHAFLKAHMPAVAERFSHRHYDVSAIKLFCESLGMPRLPKGEVHRSRSDVAQAIDHARACARWLGKER